MRNYPEMGENQRLLVAKKSAVGKVRFFLWVVVVVPGVVVVVDWLVVLTTCEWVAFNL